MTQIAGSGPIAWQPLTPKGVAAFANASLRRLLLVQFVFALLVAGVVVWFFDTAWFPVIGKTFRELPAKGELRGGRIGWSEKTPAVLAQGRFLALSVDLDHTGAVRVPTDVQVEFGESNIRFISLFGSLDVRYPRGCVIVIDRAELQPWWGAWAAPVLWITFAVVVMAMMIAWAALATLLCWLAWLAGFFANRELSLGGSWKVSGAAMMPGALLMIVAILAYGLGFLDLIQLMAAEGMHLVFGVVYCPIGAMFVTRMAGPSSKKRNPFAR